MKHPDIEFLAGNVSYPLGHPLWQTLLLSDFASTANVEDIAALARHIVTHNPQTGNFRCLLVTVVNQMRALRDLPVVTASSASPIHTGLLLIRLLMSRFLRVLSPKEISELIQGPKKPTATAGEWEPKVLLTELLMSIISSNPGESVAMYVELLNLTLTLLSMQIFHPSEEMSLFFNSKPLDFKGLANAMVSKLLRNSLLDLVDKAFQPVGLFSYLFGAGRAQRPEVADLSMFLLALLTNQEWKKAENPFRDAIKNLRNKAPEQSISLFQSACCPFDRLYELLSLSVSTSQGSLLLYVLVLDNRSFREYLFSNPEPQKLLLPILRYLYQSLTIPTPDEFAVPERPLDLKLVDCHIYLLLICLLILTGDVEYNRRLNTIDLRSVPWFKEHTLLVVSLSSLAALVLIRAIQSNLRGLRDPFIHNNFLGCLANMSNHFHGLHPYATQRLILLLQMVGKKYLGLQRKLTEESPLSSRSSIGSISPSTPDQGELDVAVLLSDLDNQSHIAIYAELVMLILEIINAILTKNLAGNPNLIYSLLHEQAFFAHLRAPPKFSALVENIETVIVHFKSRLADANLDGGYEEMLRLIEKESQKWPRSKLRELLEIGYVYEEEKNVKEFFCPFVWSSIARYPLMGWSVAHLPMFAEFVA